MESIEELLIDNYNLNIKSITDAPRGFVAETYVVNTEDNKYFLKILKKNRYSVNILKALPALKELRDSGIDYINYPIQTVNNDLYIANKDQYIILFNYIEGSNTWEYDLIEVYEKLIKIHKLIGSVASDVNREDFKIRYSKEFEDSLKRYKDLDVIKEYINDIKQYWTRFLRLSEVLSKENFKMYLTHGDALGNIIKQDNKIFIIDWDDLILAPLERDLWFSFSKKEVLDLYMENFENFKVNEDLIKYYVYNRFFDDLLGFFELLDKNPDKERRGEICKDIREDCIEWTYQLIKNLD